MWLGRCAGFALPWGKFDHQFWNLWSTQFQKMPQVQALSSSHSYCQESYKRDYDTCPLALQHQQLSIQSKRVKSSPNEECLWRVGFCKIIFECVELSLEIGIRRPRFSSSFYSRLCVLLDKSPSLHRYQASVLVKKKVVCRVVKRKKNHICALGGNR